MFSGSRDWIHDPWKGRVNARNEKNPPLGGFFEGLVLEHHPFAVTGSGEPCYKTPPKFAS